MRVTMLDPSSFVAHEFVDTGIATNASKTLMRRFKFLGERNVIVGEEGVIPSL